MSENLTHQRLDIALVTRNFAQSRQIAKKLISAALVRVDGKVITKPAYLTPDDAVIAVESNEITKYVSRGALKLEKALYEFEVNVNGMTAVDFGASTGGFTDLLLQRGAQRVYALENGHDQLHEKLKSDARVVSYDGINARYIEKGFIPLCDIAVMDVSFISQCKLYNSVINVLRDGGAFISLLKPQFELGKAHVGKNGIVKDVDKIIDDLVDEITQEAVKYNLTFHKITSSPILGGDGNKEYLLYFTFKE